MLLALGTLAGGLGLFLLAVAMITDGLKIAAGAALRDILTRSTKTTWRGLISGFILTGLVQSSSAVTVATIGFVNAGLLGIHQALGIVLGATVGTTMTGWLVAAVGFQFKISTFALPMLGAGMLMRMIGPNRRLGAVGEALAGFGLFFLGIDFLREAFTGVAAGINLGALSPEGFTGAVLFVLVGFAMTLLTQSSSAAIALTLTALTGGLISFPAAAAAAIGATVGTTSTSALAVIGATPNAKRVAAGHVLINSFNAVIGIAMLPVVILLYQREPSVAMYPALSLAVFHTVFNILGVLLQSPLMARLGNWLSGRFVDLVEQLGRPQFLDRNIMASPELALHAFMLELQRMAELTRSHAVSTLSNEGPPGKQLKDQHDGLRQLAQSVEIAVTQLESERLHADVSRHLPTILRIAGYIDEAVAQAQENAENDADVEFLLQTPVRDEILAYQLSVLKLIENSDPRLDGFSAEQLELAYQQLREQWRKLKTRLLEAGVAGQVPVRRLNPAIDSLRIMLRVAERSTRIAIRLAELGSALPSAGAVEPVSDTSVVALAESEIRQSSTD